MSNYAAKSNLKGAAGIDTSNFAQKANLTSLKLNTDRLDINKLETTSADLSILKDVVKNEVVENTVYYDLNKKFRN